MQDHPYPSPQHGRQKGVVSQRHSNVLGESCCAGVVCLCGSVLFRITLPKNPRVLVLEPLGRSSVGLLSKHYGIYLLHDRATTCQELAGQTSSAAPGGLEGTRREAERTRETWEVLAALHRSICCNNPMQKTRRVDRGGPQPKAFGNARQSECW